MKLWCQIILLWIGLCFSLPSMATGGANSCTLDDESHRASTVIAHAASAEHVSLYFTCMLHEPTVLHFPLYYDDTFALTMSDGTAIPSLTSVQRAFLLPQGRTSLVLTSLSATPLKLEVSFTPFESFSRDNSLAIAFSFVSTGFFLAMGIQISLVGRRLKRKELYFYPLYIFTVMSFFIFQEGANNIVIPEWTFLNDFSVRAALAGLSILAGYFFLSSVLRFRDVLSIKHRNILDTLAVMVALITLAQLFLPLEEARFLSDVLGYVSLLCLALVISGNLIAIKHKVVASHIILLGIVSLFLTMGLRVFTHDTFPIVSRYALILGVLIEAVIFSVAISHQVKRIRSQWAQARYESHMDPLCPVLNRRGWFRHGQELLQAHKELGGFLTVVFIDLDDFKKVNDTHGHNVGDELLIVTTRIITNQARDEDIIGRVGGDEFVVMSHSYDQHKAELIIRRLRDKFTNLTVTIGGLNIQLKASVGGKVFAVAQDDLQKTLQEVDQLMYSVKRQRQQHRKLATDNGVG